MPERRSDLGLVDDWTASAGFAFVARVTRRSLWFTHGRRVGGCLWWRFGRDQRGHQTEPMDPTALLIQLQTEVEELDRLVATGLPDFADKPVPACEAMALAELVRHVSSVHHLVTDWVRAGRRPNTWAQSPQAGQDLAVWARAGSATLLETLASLSPARPCATWSATDRTVGFWIRRMAHETAVHRVDAAQALGERWRVDPELAVDGVAEALELWLGTRLGTRVAGSGRVVRLVTGARPGAAGVDWTIRPLRTIVEFGRGPAGVDVTVTGTPAALWAWTWGRSDQDHHVDTVGDQGAADEVRGLLGRAQQ